QKPVLDPESMLHAQRRTYGTPLYQMKISQGRDIQPHIWGVLDPLPVHQRLDQKLGNTGY
ncbi:MAG: hypothetical protein ACKPFF_27800, partial [Planktothrix sp.]